ncbi:hypothetical protein Ciccas_003033 [Cichlidogyrus casuarinus]|uniref:Uncharacterized protein n=1 Tax=Cichlidogyrus casuarinus TaxID=1844966 RepID=A0ABD2QIS6_9PLAT
MVESAAIEVILRDWDALSPQQISELLKPLSCLNLNEDKFQNWDRDCIFAKFSSLLSTCACREKKILLLKLFTEAVFYPCHLEAVSKSVIVPSLLQIVIMQRDDDPLVKQAFAILDRLAQRREQAMHFSRDVCVQTLYQLPLDRQTSYTFLHGLATFTLNLLLSSKDAVGAHFCALIQPLIQYSLQHVCANLVTLAIKTLRVLCETQKCPEQQMERYFASILRDLDQAPQVACCQFIHSFFKHYNRITTKYNLETVAEKMILNSSDDKCSACGFEILSSLIEQGRHSQVESLMPRGIITATVFLFIHAKSKLVKMNSLILLKRIVPTLVESSNLELFLRHGIYESLHVSLDSSIDPELVVHTLDLIDIIAKRTVNDKSLHQFLLGLRQVDESHPNVSFLCQ